MWDSRLKTDYYASEDDEEALQQPSFLTLITTCFLTLTLTRHPDFSVRPPHLRYRLLSSRSRHLVPPRRIGA